MNWFLIGSAITLAAIWTANVVQAALGIPRVADLTDDEWNVDPEEIEGKAGKLQSVTIVVPARNESVHIDEALRSLLALDYPNYKIITINDRSTDDTGELMERVARDAGAGKLRVEHVQELPAGWLGKTHAMWMAARDSASDWILFTDADVVFAPDSLRRAMAYVECQKADHLVLFPTMLMYTWDERMMMGFFQAMFMFSNRPWKVGDPKSRDFVGVGAFNMVRRSVYEAIGTYERMKLAVIDDMRLGELVKKNGYAQRTAFGNNLVRIHWATGALGIVHGLTKNFFAFMRFNWLLAVLATMATLWVNLMPFVGVLVAHGWVRALYAVALVGIAFLYIGFSSRTQIPVYTFLLHPLSTVLFSYSILRSTFLTLARGGITWRETFYSIEELKQGQRN